MPDEISQAADSQASEEAQIPEQAAQQQAAQPMEPQTEATPTREEMRRIAQEEATRIAQSQVAKGENRINARIKEQFDREALPTAGDFPARKPLEQNRGVLGLSDEQVAQARQRIVTEAYNEPQADSEELHPLAQIAFPIFEEEGVTIEEGDPEFEKLKPYLDSPQLRPQDVAKFSRELYAQIQTKKARTASDKEKAKLRAPSGGAAGPVSGFDPDQPASFYLEEAERKRAR